jgi:uncharacterized protein YjbJ (UPF0337 family)
MSGLSSRPTGSSSGLSVRLRRESVSRWSGRLKELAGSVLGDEKLQALGRLEREAAETRRRARRTKSVADTDRHAATLRSRAAELSAKHGALEAEEQAEFDRKRIAVRTASDEDEVDRAAEIADAEVNHRRAVLEGASRRAEMEAQVEYAHEQRRAAQADAAAEDLRRRADSMDED